MTMKAAIVTETGVQFQDMAIPTPGPTEVLVKIQASALNRADLGMAAGGQHGPSGGVGSRLGLEWSGEVVAVGDQVIGFAVGDRAMCSGLGGFAEYAVADFRRCFQTPKGMDWSVAATLPVALRTMCDAVLINGMMQKGQSVLIHGASSGVGLMGMQIAKKCGAKQVLGSSTTAEKRDRLKEFGCDVAIDTTDPNWSQQVLDATDGKGVDLVVDQLSGPYINETLAATAILGRIVNVGRLAGVAGDFNFDLHAYRRISYVGVTFRTRSIEEVAEINDRVKSDLWKLVEAGELTLPIDRDLPLMQLNEAYQMMRTNQHFGKITVTPGN